MRPELTTEGQGQGSLVETILGAVGDGIIVFDVQGRILYANEPAAHALGMPSVAELKEMLLSDVSDKFEVMDEEGRPYPSELLPGRLVLAGKATRPEVILRFRVKATGEERWAYSSARPLLSADGAIEASISIFRDITELKRTERTQRFLAEATEILNRSLDVRETLANLARLSVPALADWCIVHTVRRDGMIEPDTVAHADPEMVRWAEELRDRWPPEQDSPTGIPAVVRTGQPEHYPEITDEMLVGAARDPEHLELIRSLGMRSAVTVPVAARETVLGTMTFVWAESGRRYDERDLELLQELARRAGFALENARLYEESEARGRASLVLSHVEDAVFLVDQDGLVRLWNQAASRLTGLPETAVLGRPAEEAVPGWGAVVPLVRVGSLEGAGRVPLQTLPLDLGERELWIAVSGIVFEEGVVYVFRDLTAERQIEELKTEFLATASHELRTPLAAVYGAAMTLRRPDLVLDNRDRSRLLDVVAAEADRLTRIVDDILWASRLDSGRLEIALERFDASVVARAIVDAARAHLPDGVHVKLAAPKKLPAVSGDADKVGQVLANLIDNAVKYSPDGGTVDVRLEPQERRLLFSVRDVGIGIPPSEQGRIFEKFYRLDPNLTQGVGGTGLGLYISRELVRRMGGRIWVASSEREGSTFFFELPLAQ
jgi:PAS domain S-box-containing protein